MTTFTLTADWLGPLHDDFHMIPDWLGPGSSVMTANFVGT